jgi:hypothetical protein
MFSNKRDTTSCIPEVLFLLHMAQYLVLYRVLSSNSTRKIETIEEGLRVPVNIGPALQRGSFWEKVMRVAR